jgi:thiamine transport system ATP-binding protein
MTLHLIGVTVTYDRTVAVDDVSLTLTDGVLALLGPSGCGKSTLLRAIAGLEPVAAGSISFDGVDLARVPVFQRRFGLMFQDGVLFPHRTVGRNIEYGLRGQSKGERRRRVDELLELVGLPGYADRPVGTLSGGQAQRVALARALAPSPRLLLLDEPLAALDTTLREQLLADLRVIFESTRTPTIFVTHDQGEAYGVADRVALMVAGRIVQTGPKADVWRRPVDEQAARFLGYGAVIEDGATLGLPGRIAVRPSAFEVDTTGSVRGRVVSLASGPDRSLAQVQTDGLGTLPAVVRAGMPVLPGDLVWLRFEPAGAAVLGGGAELPESTDVRDMLAR